MIAVMGATGHTGRRIAEQLLSTGKQVRALGRSAARLSPLAQAGAEIGIGDVADAAFLTSAFRGADAVYALLPTDRRAPDYLARQQEEGQAIADAVRAAGVPYVVALSSLGAELPDGTGLITGLHRQEERLRVIETANVLLLRTVSFFENLCEQVPMIETHGVLADSVARDVPFPMVATRDIADIAAAALAARDWSGVVVRELLGSRDLTYEEITRIVGERIRRPDLQYVQLAYSDMAAALTQTGLSESFARLYVDMTRAFNDRRVGPREGRIAANTTSTTLEQFLDEEFKRAHGLDPALSDRGRLSVATRESAGLSAGVRTPRAD